MHATSMPTDRTGGRDLGGLIFVAVFVAVMWVAEIVDAVAFNLDAHGIRPREIDGLQGIAFAPVLHGGFGHLVGNTVPFLVLGAAIALSGLMRIVAVTVIVMLVGGLGTWLTAASGTVHIVMGVAVLLVYGGTLMLGLVPTPGVSWHGHAFGAVGGVVAAWLLDRRRTTLS